MATITYTGNEGTRIQDSNAVWLGIIIQSTVRQSNLTIGTTAVAIPTTALSNRKNMIIFNNSTSGQILYLGDSTVSSSNGLPIYPRSTIKVDITSTQIYGISSASGADIRILEGA